MPKTSAFSIALCGLSLGLVTGCIASPQQMSEADETALLDAYRARSQALQTSAKQNEYAITIAANRDGNGLVLSADLRHADVETAIQQILQDPRLQYQVSAPHVSGRVSARFRELPLLDGLNVLLDGTSVKAVNRGAMIALIANETGSADAEPENSRSTTRTEIILNHIAAADAEQLVLNLFPSDEESEDVPLSVGSLAELNAIYLSGPLAKVRDAKIVIEQADRPVAHVIIEALVVHMNASAVEEIGLSLSDGASGKFSGIGILPNQTAGNLVATFSDLAANSAQVTATIEFLAAQNAAKVLARPYIATRTTKPAQIEIVNDQFARVDVTGDDSSIISTDSVTAGVSMSITPIVMAGQGIRLDMTIEDSRFGIAAGDVIITKERNTASTSMIVNSGQTIVIGGLNSTYRLTENMGPPWLRRVPGLNALFGSRAAIDVRNELVVYITPYIWIPSLDTPLPLRGTPTLDMGDFVSFETLIGP